MNKSLKKMGSHLKWYHSRNRIFDFVKGYFFQIGATPLIDNPNFKFIEIPLPTNLDEATRESIITAIDKKKNVIKHTRVMFNEHILFLQFVQNFRYVKEKKLTIAIEIVVGILEEQNIERSKVCAICDLEKEVEICQQNNIGVLCCEPCFETCKVFYNDENRKFQHQNLNYSQGFLGALLFSMGGVALWVLIAVLFNYITTLGAFAIAILSQVGYNYFKGKPDNKMKYFVILAGIIAIILANFFSYLIQMKNLGIDFSNSFVLLFNDPTVWSSFSADTMLSLFFGAIIWFFMLFEKGQQKLNIEKAKRMASI